MLSSGSGPRTKRPLQAEGDGQPLHVDVYYSSSGVAGGPTNYVHFDAPAPAVVSLDFAAYLPPDAGEPQAADALLDAAARQLAHAGRLLAPCVVPRGCDSPNAEDSPVAETRR